MITNSDNVNTIYFDAFEKTREELIQSVIYIFNYHNLIKSNNIDAVKFSKLIYRIESLYKEVDYHNFVHAFNVFQMCHLIFMRTNATKFIGTFNSFLFFIGAIAHDMGHIGLCNKALVSTRHTIALKYNLKSPLENHHVYLLANLLFDDPETGIFKEHSLKDKNIIHEILYELIIYTDMDLHHDFIKRLRKHSDRIISYTKNMSMPGSISISQQIALTILVSFLKFADISNEFRPFDVFIKTYNSLISEFNKQSEFEAQNDVHLTIDLSKVSRKNLEKYFSENFIFPLLDELCKIFPQFEEFKSELSINIGNFNKMFSTD